MWGSRGPVDGEPARPREPDNRKITHRPNRSSRGASAKPHRRRGKSTRPYSGSSSPSRRGPPSEERRSGPRSSSETAAPCVPRTSIESAQRHDQETMSRQRNNGAVPPRHRLPEIPPFFLPVRHGHFLPLESFGRRTEHTQFVPRPLCRVSRTVVNELGPQFGRYGEAQGSPRGHHRSARRAHARAAGDARHALRSAWTRAQSGWRSTARSRRASRC